MPVEILGMNSSVFAGAEFFVTENEDQAKEIFEFRKNNSKVNKVLAKDLAKLIYLSDSEKITANSAKEIVRKLFNSDKSIDSIISEDSYLDNTDNNIKDIIKKVLDQNPNEVDRFRNGEEKLLSYFMGKAMKESKGKVSHKIIS